MKSLVIILRRSILEEPTDENVKIVFTLFRNFDHKTAFYHKLLHKMLQNFLFRTVYIIVYLTRDYFGGFITERGKCGPGNRWRIRSNPPPFAGLGLSISTFITQLGFITSGYIHDRGKCGSGKYGDIDQNPSLYTGHNNPD